MAMTRTYSSSLRHALAVAGVTLHADDSTLVEVGDVARAGIRTCDRTPQRSRRESSLWSIRIEVHARRADALLEQLLRARSNAVSVRWRILTARLLAMPKLSLRAAVGSRKCLPRLVCAGEPRPEHHVGAPAATPERRRAGNGRHRRPDVLVVGGSLRRAFQHRTELADRRRSHPSRAPSRQAYTHLTTSAPALIRSRYSAVTTLPPRSTRPAHGTSSSMARSVGSDGRVPVDHQHVRPIANSDLAFVAGSPLIRQLRR